MQTPPLTLGRGIKAKHADKLVQPVHGSNINEKLILVRMNKDIKFIIGVWL